jgi:hypothetical protein
MLLVVLLRYLTKHLARYNNRFKDKYVTMYELSSVEKPEKTVERRLKMSKNSHFSSKNLNLNSFDEKMLQIQCFRTARLLGGLEPTCVKCEASGEFQNRSTFRRIGTRNNPVNRPQIFGFRTTRLLGGLELLVSFSRVTLWFQNRPIFRRIGTYDRTFNFITMFQNRPTFRRIGTCISGLTSISNCFRIARLLGELELV